MDKKAFALASPSAPSKRVPKGKNNKGLHGAKRRKDDEFYTTREMIEAEFQHYPTRLFRDKHILCNCNDGEQSEFFRFFADNFDRLKLRQLVGLSYSGYSLPFAGERAYKISLRRDQRQRAPVKEFLTADDGSFDGTQGTKELQACDIVVTNPPYSRWQHFIRMLINSKKRFLVICSITGVSEPNLFLHLRDGKAWTGSTIASSGFIPPDGSVGNALPNNVWFSNLPHRSLRKRAAPLTHKYSPQEYPRYDNYPAIEVGEINKIPADYYGKMVVPVTFFKIHNPKQFIVLASLNYASLNGQQLFQRIIIQRADPSKQEESAGGGRPCSKKQRAPNNPQNSSRPKQPHHFQAPATKP